jgi:hypothetical protein
VQERVLELSVGYPAAPIWTGSVKSEIDDVLTALRLIFGGRTFDDDPLQIGVRCQHRQAKPGGPDVVVSISGSARRLSIGALLDNGSNALKRLIDPFAVPSSI